MKKIPYGVKLVKKETPISSTADGAFGIVLYLSGGEVLRVMRLLESLDNVGTLSKVGEGKFYIRTTRGMLPELLSAIATLSLPLFKPAMDNSSPSKARMHLLTEQLEDL